ncbi:MAG: hypothetical protein ACFFAU_12190 [Candidatus Hodarchaeota archaeon]
MNAKKFFLCCLLLVILNPIQWIKAEELIIYDRSFSIGPNSYIWCSFNITSLPMYGYFEVTCNSVIDLYIMNENDFQEWFAGETENCAFYSEVSNTSLYFTFSGTGIWYVVLENANIMNIYEKGHLIITLSDSYSPMMDQRFIYTTPGLPQLFILVAELAVFVSFLVSIIYVKFLTKQSIKVVVKKNSFN